MRIAFCDDWLVVVDKPAGLAAHAASGVDDDLLTRLRAIHPTAALLHRLDREASGLVLCALRPEATGPLQAQLEAHEIERVYLAVLAGVVPFDERVVDRPIPERAQGRGALHRRPPPDAKPARSRFVVQSRGVRTSLVEVTLETGRKHQIRVHAAVIGHPIVGDRRYGGPPAPRLALHATRLTFHHPEDGRVVVVESLLPPDLTALMPA